MTSQLCFLHDHKFRRQGVMVHKTLASLAAAASLLTMAAVTPPAHAQDAADNQVMTNGPQSSGAEQSGGWSARQNVIQSHRYERLVETSPRFRQARVNKECGPITDPQLHEQCVASFSQDEPTAYGSSTPPRHHRY